MADTGTSWRERIGRYAERRLPALTRHRQAEPLPIRLHARRIYILPTRFGMVFGVIVIAMLMGALNFNNNPALLLAFLVSGVAIVSFHHTVGQLREISLISLSAARPHAGSRSQVNFSLRDGGGRNRPALMLEQGKQEVAFALAANETAIVRIDFLPLRRGWQSLGRWRLWSEYPFGIVWAWSYLHPEEPLLIYPGPEANAPALPLDDRDRPGAQQRSPGDDWAGLRDHRAGDPPRHVAWKASARSDRLLVKEFADPVSEAMVLDYHQLGALEHEQRISRLTAWILQAERTQASFRLVLPGQALGPGAGGDFVSRCLRELALLP